MRFCSRFKGIIAALPLLCSQISTGSATQQSAGNASEAAKPLSSAPDAKIAAVENSVVKVFSTARYPDFYKPWTKHAPSEASATGVVIEGKRILSNAHERKENGRETGASISTLKELTPVLMSLS